MKQKPSVKDLLDKEMSRQDFLKVASVGALSVIGAGNVVALIMAQRPQQQQRTGIANQSVKATHGFGASKFGV